MENKNNFQIFQASIIGSEHIRLRKNNQDGIMLGKAKINNKTYFFGVICDGCGEGSNSEVGAKLLSRFICEEIPLVLSAATPIEEEPNVLFMRCLGYLRSIAGQTITGHENFASFVNDYLLCTVLGFLIYEEKILIFNIGDGIIIMNDSVRRIDKGNKPPYIGYHLVDRKLLEDYGAKLPHGFEVSIVNLNTIEKMAICSDGFKEEFVNQLFGHDKQISLQRALNRLSFFKSAFSDDCSIIVVEKIEKSSKVKGGNSI